MDSEHQDELAASLAESTVSAGIDWENLLRQFAENLSILDKTIEAFLRSAPSNLIELRQAEQTYDPRRLMKVAHRLKGSVGIFTDSGAYLLLQKLEASAQDGNWLSVHSLLAAVEREIGQLQRQLQQRKLA